MGQYFFPYFRSKSVCILKKCKNDKDTEYKSIRLAIPKHLLRAELQYFTGVKEGSFIQSGFGEFHIMDLLLRSELVHETGDEDMYFDPYFLLIGDYNEDDLDITYDSSNIGFVVLNTEPLEKVKYVHLIGTTAELIFMRKSAGIPLGIATRSNRGGGGDFFDSEGRISSPIILGYSGSLGTLFYNTAYLVSAPTEITISFLHTLYKVAEFGADISKLEQFGCSIQLIKNRTDPIIVPQEAYLLVDMTDPYSVAEAFVKSLSPDQLMRAIQRFRELAPESSWSELVAKLITESGKTSEDVFYDIELGHGLLSTIGGE